MLYIYTRDPHYTPVLGPSYRRQWGGVLSLVFLFLGLALIGQVVYPIVSWYAFALPGYSGAVVSPLASNFAPYNPAILSVLPTPVQAAETSATSFKPSSWFPAAKPFTQEINSDLKTYTISIPKLKIDSTTVEIGGDNLKKSLVAWPTSATPGDYGVNIIFGHSELPQFASPDSFSGIFTHIMDLADGDTVYVDYDGVRYKYLVYDRQVVDPDNLSVLEQRFDDRYLSLITCVPPGTIWKRGVVKARMSQ